MPFALWTLECRRHADQSEALHQPLPSECFHLERHNVIIMRPSSSHSNAVKSHKQTVTIGDTFVLDRVILRVSCWRMLIRQCECGDLVAETDPRRGTK